MVRVFGGVLRGDRARTTGVIGAGAAVAMLGALALVGWASGWIRLASLGPDWIPMAPSTALLFLTSGISLSLRAGAARHRGAWWASASAGVLSGLASSVFLALAALGARAPIEHLGFGAVGEVQGAPTGHMSIVTAAWFLVASISAVAALGAPRARRARVVSTAAAALVLCTSAVFLLAYLYGAPLLYGGPIIPPALTTVLAFAVLGGGLLTRLEACEQAVSADDHRAEQQRTFEILALTFVLLASGLVTAGHYYFKSEERQFRGDVEARLAAIGELKVREIGEWRRARLADGAVFSDNRSFSVVVRRYLDNPSQPGANVELSAWLERIQLAGTYDRVALLDARSSERMWTPGSSEPTGVFVAQHVNDALRSSGPIFLDFYRDGPDGRIFLAVLAPIFDQGPDRQPLGVLVLRVDPSEWLYPFLQLWPGPSNTAETFLVRRDGDHAVFLNGLRFNKRAALELTSPLDDRRSTAARAALGEEGVVEGTDYRGVPVVACLRAVPDSPWKMVVRRDSSEAFTPLSGRLLETVLGVMLLLASAATGLGLVFRQHSLSAERRYRRALDSMMEGAQIIGSDWRYLYVNHMAARYGRRTASELLGRTVMEMYPGIEGTRLFDVLRRSMQDRVPFHGDLDFTLPGGEQRSFEFSVHSIPEGLFVLSLDVTDRKLSEEALRDREARIAHLNAVLRGIRNVNQLITRERDPHVLVSKACDLLVESRGFEVCCILVHEHDDLVPAACAGADQQLKGLRDMLARKEIPSCVREAVTQGAQRTPAVSCAQCAMSEGCVVPRDAIAVRLENAGKLFGAMLVSVPPGTASDPEEIDLLNEIAGDVAFALQGIERDAEQARATEEIESLARFTSEDPNPVLRFAADGRILVANASSKPLLEHWRCAVGDRPPEEIRRQVTEAIETGQRASAAVRVGESLEYLLVFAPVKAGEYVNGYGMDVTDRVGAEMDVRRLNSRLLRLAQVAQDLSRARTLDAITRIVRHAARDLAGCDGATFVLREGDLCQYVDEDAIGPLWKGKRFPMEECISGWAMLHREPVAIEDIYADPRIPHDAYRATFVKSLAMVPIRSESPIGAIGAYWARRYRASAEEIRILQALADSTSVAMENVRAYTTLAESEARTRAIYEHLPSPTFVWARRGTGFVLEGFNEAARAATHNGIVEFVGRTAASVPHSFPNLVEDLERCLETRAPIRREIEYTPPGARSPRRLKAAYGFVPPATVVLHTEDITEQLQLEEQLRLAQRMESVGRLAGGVAHDFNNLLSVILNYASLALEDPELPAAMHEDIQEIHKAGVRAAGLTGQLLAFSRKQVLQPRIVCLNDVVGGVAAMLRRLVGEDIRFSARLDPDLGDALVDPGQIEQVVMNLAVNARDAMPHGGALTISTSNATLDDSHAGSRDESTPGRYVVLTVGDTGCGMDEQTRARIFEPFFTTKGQGKGTGLGLATVYGIVKQSGGSIRVQTEVGKGTTFDILLPLAESRGEVFRSMAPPSVRNVGSETILLVEDDAALMKLATRILRAEGYTVLAASDGDEAVRLAEQPQQHLDLLLTDVIMPGMSGRELATKLIAKRPNLAVLYMSGYTDDAILRHGLLDGDTMLIAKPFTAPQLMQKVREVLELARQAHAGEG